MITGGRSETSVIGRGLLTMRLAALTSLRVLSVSTTSHSPALIANITRHVTSDGVKVCVSLGHTHGISMTLFMFTSYYVISQSLCCCYAKNTTKGRNKNA